MDLQGQLRILKSSDFFDSSWYAERYPEVNHLGLEPEIHFLKFGYRLDYNPNPSFSMANYLANYPDVRSDGGNPLFHYILFGRAEGRTSNKLSVQNYDDWISIFEAPEKLDTARESAMRSLKSTPLISIIMPVYETPVNLLAATIESVQEQSYKNWELCICDDASKSVALRKFLNEIAEQDQRIKITHHGFNQHISAASNTALGLAKGEWIALLDHDDILSKDALLEVAATISKYACAEIIYSDEDKIDDKGMRYDPYFKPCYNQELFRAQNYFNHLTVHRRKNIEKVGGWRSEFDGSQDYDLTLRILERIQSKHIFHIPKVLYHWRASEGSTALSGSEKSYAFTAGMRALQEHADRILPGTEVCEVENTGYYRWKLSDRQASKKVSLLIPTRDKVDLLRNCISSIIAKTTYKNYEILIIDNGSVEAETHEYFRTVIDNPKIRVASYDQPFNYSAINNFGAKLTDGDIIGLVNNDIEVISPDWLDEMVGWASIEGNGCIGAKLYYGNDTVQHGGVILGIGGVAGHSHKHSNRDQHGYFGRLKLTQNLSAVTAACLLVRREIFEQVGGLDEQNLSVAFNDVDFCLRVLEAGYSNVWTPFAEMYHLESVSRGIEDTPEKIARANLEVDYMKSRWGDCLKRDPHYSPNLTLVHEDFSFGEYRP